MITLALINVYLLAIGVASISAGYKLEELAGDQSTYILYMTRFQSEEAAVKNTFKDMSIYEIGRLLLYITGGILCFMSALGFLILCCGKRSLLLIFIILLVLIFVVELALCALAFTFKANADEGLELHLDNSIEKHYTGPKLSVDVDINTLGKDTQDSINSITNVQSASNETNATGISTVPKKDYSSIKNILAVEQYDFVIRDQVRDYLANTTAYSAENKIALAFDRMMLWLECCGSKNYSDFDENSEDWQKEIDIVISGRPSGQQTNLKFPMLVPVTCCRQHKKSHPPEVTFLDMATCVTSATAATTEVSGCHEPLKDHIITYSNAIGSLSLVFLVAQLFAIVVACLLMDEIEA